MKPSIPVNRLLFSADNISRYDKSSFSYSSICLLFFKADKYLINAVSSLGFIKNISLNFDISSYENSSLIPLLKY